MIFPQLLKHFSALQEEIHDHYHDFNVTAVSLHVKHFHTAHMIRTPTHAFLNGCCYGNLGGYYYYNMTYFGLLHTTVLWNC